ncbi:MAG: STAS/SEC14 domain-containing protein [Flavobacteriales bacterium]|nr:STAS/SEC14 domain-containing protein [Flavobacteriales bacterium]
MIEQLKISEKNVLAIEVIDAFTETDERYCQKLFEQKREQGFEQVNVLVKLDEIKISKTSIKVFFEDMVWVLRNYKHLGHLAIVAHSNILKVLVPIDNLFFARASKEREERYFDISQIEETFNFVNETSKN